MPTKQKVETAVLWTFSVEGWNKKKWLPFTTSVICILWYIMCLTNNCIALSWQQKELSRCSSLQSSLSSIQSFSSQELDNIDKWGMDIFKINILTNHRPLTCVAYTLFEVSSWRWCEMVKKIYLLELNLYNSIIKQLKLT